MSVLLVTANMLVSDIDILAADDLDRTVRSAIHESFSHETLALHEPWLPNETISHLSRVVDSGFVSGIGPAVVEFEQRLSELHGVEFVISTSSGTAALQLALIAAGVQPGDHVAVPSLTFIATANAVSHIGATPVFLDCGKPEHGTNFGISTLSLKELLFNYNRTRTGLFHKETGARLSAIVPVHILGRLTSVEEILATVDHPRLAVVEDAAEAIGSEHPNRRGKFASSSSAVLSFNGNKTITTGGGGAVLTDSPETAAKVRHLSTTAKVEHPWRYSHDEVGWNYRLPAICAALGLAQLNNLGEILERKRVLFDAYVESFQQSEYFEVVLNPSGQSPNNWLACVMPREGISVNIDSVISISHTKGVLVRPMWDLVNLQRPYKSCLATTMSNAQEVRESIICLPSSPKLARDL